RPIYCLKIGKGEENALLFSFPHPNEPIGSMSLEFLSQFLAKNPEFTKKTGYTWYLIKAIDIDGAILNEGWFKGKFTPLKYLKYYYRPAPYQQVEWSFPINYKKLKFDSPGPETQALMHLIQKIKPKFMYSLHNSGFGGVYFYISYGIGTLFNDLVDFVNREQLPLHLGEPEAPYIRKLHEGIFQMFGVQGQYNYLESYGIENPQEFIKNGTSSYDYLKSVVSEKSFTLVCEMPYFYNISIGDTSLTEFERRELRMQSLEYEKEIAIEMKKNFRHIKKYCDKSTRMYTAVEGYIKILRPGLELEINVTKTSPEYNGKATVSQAFDLNTAIKYYDLLTISMVVRLCEEAILIHSEKKLEITKIKNDLERWIEQKISDLLSNIKFGVIPIQKLVRVQIGSAFITLENLNKE
ncbi:MAG: zinc carboxypeptidase, partial [Candidatus Lokiarchaeota archaeon]|nr:zinc carboxypeptidase [Candidatus Lokiarchaeota archaeon]